MSIKKALLLSPERLTQKDLYLFYRYARLLLVELSQLAVRSENLFDLVLVELDHEVTSRSAVLTRVELTRFLSEYLTYSCSEGQTRVRVDVDLANSALGCLAELLLRNTNCVRQLSAILVDHVNIFLWN